MPKIKQLTPTLVRKSTLTMKSNYDDCSVNRAEWLANWIESPLSTNDNGANQYWNQFFLFTLTHRSMCGAHMQPTQELIFFFSNVPINDQYFVAYEQRSKVYKHWLSNKDDHTDHTKVICCGAVSSVRTNWNLVDSYKGCVVVRCSANVAYSVANWSQLSWA